MGGIIYRIWMRNNANKYIYNMIKFILVYYLIYLHNLKMKKCVRECKLQNKKIEILSVNEFVFMLIEGHNNN